MQVPIQRQVLRGIVTSMTLVAVALSGTPAPADWDRDGSPDLVIVGRKGASGKTEVHVLSGASNYRDFLAHTATVLGHTDERSVFRIADWDQDGRPDLVMIDRKGASGRTEIHVLSGASNFQQFLVQIATVLGPTDAGEVEFALGDWDRDGKPDLGYIHRRNVVSGRTEVHVLSGASNYQRFIVQVATALHPTDLAVGSSWDLSLQDWNRDGTPDLVGINHRGASGKVEVHVLSGASNYQQFIVQTATLIGDGAGAGDGWVFQVINWDGDSKPDLAALRRGGASGKCEVHVLTGASQYQAFACQVATSFGIEAVSEDFRLIMVNSPVKEKAGVKVHAGTDGVYIESWIEWEWETNPGDSDNKSDDLDLEKGSGPATPFDRVEGRPDVSRIG